jgi:hypothetical protein
VATKEPKLPSPFPNRTHASTEEGGHSVLPRKSQPPYPRPPPAAKSSTGYARIGLLTGHAECGIRSAAPCGRRRLASIHFGSSLLSQHSPSRDFCGLPRCEFTGKRSSSIKSLCGWSALAWRLTIAKPPPLSGKAQNRSKKSLNSSTRYTLRKDLAQASSDY